MIDPSPNLSASSPSNGRHAVQPGAEAFFLPGGPTGVLLTHGFTSSPAEVRPLGSYLAEQGYTVYGPLLAGHGTAPEDLRTTTWQQWVATAEAGLAELRAAGCTRLALVGLSLGGTISLYLAARHPTAYLGVVTMNSPVYLPTIFEPALRWLGAGPVPFFHKGITDVAATDAGRHALTYTRTPLESVGALVAFLNAVNSSLAQVTTPTLVMYARGDRLVLPFNAMRIYDTIRTPDKQLLVLHRGGHHAPLHADAGRAFPAIHMFLQRQVAAALGMAD